MRASPSASKTRARAAGGLPSAATAERARSSVVTASSYASSSCARAAARIA